MVVQIILDLFVTKNTILNSTGRFLLQQTIKATSSMSSLQIGTRTLEGRCLGGGGLTRGELSLGNLITLGYIESMGGNDLVPLVSSHL